MSFSTLAAPGDASPTLLDQQSHTINHGLPARHRRAHRSSRSVDAARHRLRHARHRDQRRTPSRSTSTSRSRSARSCVQASGFAGVYYDGASDTGLVLELAVNVNFDVFGIVTIKGTGEIELNTTKTDHTVNGLDIGAGAFKLHIDGTVTLLDVISLQTVVDVLVGGNQTVTYGTTGIAHLRRRDDRQRRVVLRLHRQRQLLRHRDAERHRLGRLERALRHRPERRHHDRLEQLRPQRQLQRRRLADAGSVQRARAGRRHHRPQQLLQRRQHRASTTASASASARRSSVNAFGFSLASVGIGATITAAGSGTVDLVASVEV